MSNANFFFRRNVELVKNLSLHKVKVVYLSKANYGFLIEVFDTTMVYQSKHTTQMCIFVFKINSYLIRKWNVFFDKPMITK